MRHRPIAVTYGWRPILDPPHPAIPVQDGAAITINVRPAFDECPAELRSMYWHPDEVAHYLQRHDRSRSPRRDNPEHGDETALMAHQGRPLAIQPPVTEQQQAARDPHEPCIT